MKIDATSEKYSRLTLEYVKSILSYDPVTGLFTWSVNRGYKPTKGKAAGGYNKAGYYTLYIDGYWYPAHVVAWLYMTGSLPDTLIDHKDLNTSNCKWDNLRKSNTASNRINSLMKIGNKLGLKGVKKVIKHNGRYVGYTAQIGHNGKNIHIGTFKTPEEASQAYYAKAIELFGEFARR